MRADDASGLQQRATGGRKTDLGKFSEYFQTIRLRCYNAHQVEQSTNLYELVSERTRLRWTWSREAEEAAGESRPDQGMERERAFE